MAIIVDVLRAWQTSSALVEQAPSLQARRTVSS